MITVTKQRTYVNGNVALRDKKIEIWHRNKKNQWSFFYKHFSISQSNRTVPLTKSYNQRDNEATNLHTWLRYPWARRQSSCCCRLRGSSNSPPGSFGSPHIWKEMELKEWLDENAEEWTGCEDVNTTVGHISTKKMKTSPIHGPLMQPFQDEITFHNYAEIKW